MAVLRTLKGLNPGQLLTLEGESAILGRHPDCDIVLEVGAVSRQHAKITRKDDAYYVEDLHSRNGTFLNDQPVDGRQALAEDDQLRICDLVFVFHKGMPQASAAAKSGDTTFMAMMVDDGQQTSSPTVTSKVDVSSGQSGLRLTINPEAKLKALLEIGQNLGSVVGFQEVLAKLLDNLFAIFVQADRGFIVLRDKQTDALIPEAVKHRRKSQAEPIRISRTIVNGVMSGKEAILSADAATDSRFDMSESIIDFHIHSMMCAPLIGSQGHVLGVIQIDTSDQRQKFNKDDLEVLASVACQAAITVENAQLHEVALHEKVLERELAVAHKVQQGFLPAKPPEMDSYEFFDYYEPANHLGGDYFDYVPLLDGRLAVVLADVSGKGISAALLMAKLSAETRFSLVVEPTPAAAINRLNRVFSESRWEDRFITLVLTVIDPTTHTITIVNAGHMPPLLRHADASIVPVGESVGGLPLGVDGDAEYDEHEETLVPGDSLTMYTDGILDAMNLHETFYGSKRLLKQLETPEVENVQALGRTFLDDVRRFVGGHPQTDDMCVVCVGRKD